MTLPAVAPFQSCVACVRRGDTTTVVAIEGEAEWLIAILTRTTGIPEGEATQMVLDIARDRHGCQPGFVPPGRMQMFVRLCRTCAAKTGATIVEAKEVESGRLADGYYQPPESELA